MSSPAHPELIFGGALIGLSFPDPSSVSSLLGILSSNGVSAIDTAARYPPNVPGRSEELLGETEAASGKHAFAIDSKILTLGGEGDLEPAKARASLETSLRRLGVSRLRTLYIHMPDQQTPLADQARGLDELYREGKFERLGISNFWPQEVEDFVSVCENGGYVKPSVYQGDYSVIQRAPEKELFPVLMRHGIRFVAFRALAAGFLKEGMFDESGNLRAEEGTRFADGHPFAKAMGGLYGGEQARKAHELARKASEDANINPLDAALRWICFHSALTKDDAVLLGASKEAQIVKNIQAIRDGPLPKATAEQFSKLWQVLEGDVER